MEPVSNIYVPGTCNIGPEETKRRIAGGWIGLVITFLFGALLVYFPVNPWFRLVLFVPATISALGFFQAAFRFCVSFGMQGLFNVSNEAGQTETISQQEYRKADKRKAMLIIAYSVWVGIVIAFGAVYI